MPDSTNQRSYFQMPVVLLFGSQVLAGIFLAIVVPFITSQMSTAPTITVLALQGVLAALFGKLLGLSKWWGVVQLAMPFAAFYSINLQIPAWLWFLLFTLTILVFRNSTRGGVPLYLSNATTWAALAELLPQTEGAKFTDLGGGVGGTALYLAQHRPDAQFISMESAPIPAAISRLRKTFSGLENVEMRYGDLWGMDISECDLVYAFLSPVPMERLYNKVKAEMNPGSVFVSNSFEVSGVEADEVIELGDGRKTKLHLWRL